uniref:Uncharacterized protein TCIL3000_10_700 n=1 Tax=Trypanosoma congolense (strain IL3000) TaxID=1068625 RepID=G0UV96_TRYCI|nr:unnamed protein product [Trypanosoma congolense IL3000]
MIFLFLATLLHLGTLLIVKLAYLLVFVSFCLNLVGLSKANIVWRLWWESRTICGTYTLYPFRIVIPPSFYSHFSFYNNTCVGIFLISVPLAISTQLVTRPRDHRLSPAAESSRLLLEETKTERCQAQQKRLHRQRPSGQRRKETKQKIRREGSIVRRGTLNIFNI